jgi:hypothetical protein
VARPKWFTDQGGRIDPGRIPGVKPAYEQIVVDPERGIWVRPATYAREPGAVFNVFDPEGRYLGRLRLAAGIDGFPPPVIRARVRSTVLWETRWAFRTYLCGDQEGWP